MEENVNSLYETVYFDPNIVREGDLTRMNDYFSRVVTSYKKGMSSAKKNEMCHAMMLDVLAQPNCAALGVLDIESQRYFFKQSFLNCFPERFYNFVDNNPLFLKSFATVSFLLLSKKMSPSCVHCFVGQSIRDVNCHFVISVMRFGQKQLLTYRVWLSTLEIYTVNFFVDKNTK